MGRIRRRRVLHIIKSSIFRSPAQTLVNTVNTVGVMGKGIAKGFAARYPGMYREYKQLCKSKHILKGRNPPMAPLVGYSTSPQKQLERSHRSLKYFEAGLDAFVANYKAMGISRCHFPHLAAEMAS